MDVEETTQTGRPEEHAEQVDRPEDSQYYEVRHEQWDALPEHERKSGVPSPMLDHDREAGG